MSEKKVVGKDKKKPRKEEEEKRTIFVGNLSIYTKKEVKSVILN